MKIECDSAEQARAIFEALNRAFSERSDRSVSECAHLADAMIVTHVEVTRLRMIEATLGAME